MRGNESASVKFWTHHWNKKINTERLEIGRGVKKWKYKPLSKIINSLGVSRIADIGCGTCHLKDYLASELSYDGYDIVETAEGVIPINIETERLSKVYDIIVFAGVIEYIEDWQRLVTELKAQTTYLLLYMTFPKKRDRLPKTRAELDWRETSGFRNFLDYSSFLDQMSQIGWRKVVVKNNPLRIRLQKFFNGTPHFSKILLFKKM